MALKNKLFSMILTAVILTVFVVSPFIIDNEAKAVESEPRDWEELTTGGLLNEDATNSDFVVLLDAHTGKVLYEKNGSEQKFPASITKIMTCLLAIENLDMDTIVTVANISPDALEAEKAALVGLENGEEIRVKDLLYALMLESGADAAQVLAMEVSGSISAFVALMNQRAQELGMSGTNFTNPSGLHDDDHYTTAMDMAKLSYEAMKIAEFREVVATDKYTPPATNVHNAENLWVPDIWENRNDLVSTVYANNYAYNDNNGDHAIGIKTGFTTPAQSTLVGAAQSGDGTQEVIAVIMYGTPNGRFSDAVTLFKYAFEFYDTINVAELLHDNLSFTEHVENADDGGEYENLDIQAVPVGNGYITDTVVNIQKIKDNPERITSDINITSDLVAPIASGDELGTMDFYLDGDGEPILTCVLIAENSLDAKPEPTPVPTATPVPATPTPEPEPQIVTFAKNNLLYIIIGVVLVIVVVIIIAMMGGGGGRKPQRARGAAPARGRRDDTRFREGVSRGRGRRR